MKLSTIGWTDYSGGDLGFVLGCTPVSEGCQNCYAKATYDRFDKDFSKVMLYPKKLERLARTRFPEFSPKRGTPYKPMCFPVDMGDIFHENVPDEFIWRAFDIMCKRTDVIWQVLTKRPDRMRDVLFGGERHYFGKGEYAKGIWMGITTENQKRANERLPILLGCWQGTTWVSGEPMLEPIDFTAVQYDAQTTMNVLDGCGVTTRGGMMGQSIPNCYCRKLDWIIVGAESGPHRRPFDVAWARDLYDQCRACGIPLYAKQDSGLYPGNRLYIYGREIKEWPDVTL